MRGFLRNNTHQASGRRRGVTLMELLIILSVIAVLLGMLAPALSSIGRYSRMMLSQSNLRQMGIAAHAYANIYEAYPAALRYENSGGSFKSISWDWVTEFGSGELISPGPLWQFTDDPDRVMQCPEYHGKSNAPGDPHTGYNYSPYLGGEEKFSTSPGWHKVKGATPPHAVRTPARIAMFGCGGYRSGALKYMRSPLHNTHSELPLDLPTIYSGGQGFRYGGETLVTYADGHIASVPEPCKGDLATDTLLTQFMDFPHNGFLSEDDAAYNPRPRR